MKYESEAAERLSLSWHRAKRGADPRSSIEQESRAVEQRPQEVLKLFAPLSSASQKARDELRVLRGRKAAQRGQVKLLDQRLVARAPGNSPGNAAAGVRHGLGDGRAVHQVQSLRKAHLASPLALARRLSRGTPEEVKEATLVHLRIGQLRGEEALG